ncbi:polysaccharide deacetylase family protein [Thiohalophilus thiocyanatoxydans]|uniref:Polysaccharide deacetylase n=1 Tax=Thiohalophilus thiocyanatoxydans TaxID=381308 RepID=A0A4R8IW90_9GAMM|nr:polysaccharide deacetylase family protein [Thiohalophilus thiocyanatoxydans]TDY03770.1 polysaccharide deacetylase [Thiohalophilus thiocyanatoxydans]
MIDRALQTGVLRPLAGMLSPAGSRARLSILIYHRVLPRPDPMLPGDPDAATFRWQMQTVARLFNVLPLSEAVERLASGTLPPRAACITFDDGYADNVEVALPILQSQDLHATFFIAAGFLDGGMMFNDRVIETLRHLSAEALDFDSTGLAPGLGRRPITTPAERVAAAMALIGRIKHLDMPRRDEKVQALMALSQAPLPDNLMLSTAQLRALADSGMGIGGHTLNHPILSRTPDAQAREEIGGGRETLEAILNQPVRLFAYPNGKPDQDYDARHTAMVRDGGFKAAVSTAWGVSTRQHDPFQLARFTPWDSTPLRFAARLVRNMTQTRPKTA